MRNTRLLLLPLLAAPAAAQFTLPAPTLLQRAAPRAAWTAVTTAGTTVTGSTFRCDNPGAASADKLYVFGGCLDNNTATTLNDLWAFDPATGLFTQVNAGTTGPAPHARGRAAVAWNATTQKLVVFGGDTRSTGPLPANTLLADTWEWDPTTNTWADVTPVSGSPSPRRWAAMAHEPNTGGMLLFGGDNGTAVLSDTWLFLAGAWIPYAPANVPPPRRMASLVTRSDRNDVLLCGGDDSTLVNYGPDVYRHLDVWTWNGGDWTRISNYDWATQTGTFPASAFANQAVYDPLRQRVVLQGGQGIAANTSANTLFLFGTTVYNGSPTNYTSEFDCVTNTWSIYANPTTGTAPYNNNDPSIGRISRYFAGFIPSTGRIYKIGGQNPAGSSSRPTYNVYAYQASAVASTTVIGAGCTGAGGPMTLTADMLPWTSRTVQATATGFAPTSFGFGLIGFSTQSTPLATLHPTGRAGCDLLVSPDASVFLVPAGGSAVLTLGMPADNVFAGLVLNTQVLQLELGGALQLSGISSTNGLALRLGAL